jgi:hypothetical protein
MLATGNAPIRGSAYLAREPFQSLTLPARLVALDVLRSTLREGHGLRVLEPLCGSDGPLGVERINPRLEAFAGEIGPVPCLLRGDIAVALIGAERTKAHFSRHRLAAAAYVAPHISKQPGFGNAVPAAGHLQIQATSIGVATGVIYRFNEFRTE